MPRRRIDAATTFPGGRTREFTSVWRVFLMKQKPSQHKLGDFLEGKGFYIVLFLCVAAIGISGYFFCSAGSLPSRRGSGVRIPPPSADRRRCPQEDSAGQTAGGDHPPPPGEDGTAGTSPRGHVGRLHRHRGHPGGQPHEGGRFLWLRLAGEGQRRSGLQPGGLRL